MNALGFALAAAALMGPTTPYGVKERPVGVGTHEARKKKDKARIARKAAKKSKRRNR